MLMLAQAGCVQDPLPSAQPFTLESEQIQLPPPPHRALTVSVYNCIDTTGQRRPTGSSQELSTAVPMDCTPYLIEAVRSLDRGYLNLVERQHVDELLRERQIATLALNNAANGTPPRKLNTLRVAEMLLVGQVVAYDRETRQVSAGGALGGIGGNTTLVTDLITFSLRAVAVQTGEVLGQTMVTKSVTSLKVGGHLTKIFTTNVMEAELGGAGNEPVGLALRVAVRGALAQLINRGIQDKWWS
ncbi:putative Curli production assembly/transport component CsgG [Rhodovastum atsumiense]|nr:putative Curli production assembly/transport component CsgG [Rhodovastum atsumiense]